MGVQGRRGSSAQRAGQWFAIFLVLSMGVAGVFLIRASSEEQAPAALSAPVTGSGVSPGAASQPIVSSSGGVLADSDAAAPESSPGDGAGLSAAPSVAPTAPAPQTSAVADGQAGPLQAEDPPGSTTAAAESSPDPALAPIAGQTEGSDAIADPLLAASPPASVAPSRRSSQATSPATAASDLPAISLDAGDGKAAGEKAQPLSDGTGKYQPDEADKDLAGSAGDFADGYVPDLSGVTASPGADDSPPGT